ncbi:hypothetical protein [uncultured Roseobacter sp.]|uniref:hypothetical protein n=1 Tax=uncultured Roseobacter sp. TaxID=114847 RepID=UPI002606E139|nr:hypothetical protein [uncultured Roseobacter sp.]
MKTTRQKTKNPPRTGRAAEGGGPGRAEGPTRATTGTVGRLQHLADHSVAATRLGAVQRRMDDRAVVQAVGWELLDYLNPFSYFRGSSKTPEGASEEGLDKAQDVPVATAEKPVDGMAERHLPEVEPKTEKPVEPGANAGGAMLAAVPALTKTQRKNRRNRERSKERKAQTKANDNAGGMEPVPLVKPLGGKAMPPPRVGRGAKPPARRKPPSDDGFTTVTYKKTRSPEAQLRKNQRDGIKAAVRGKKMLWDWIEKPTEDGTSGKYGQGSAYAHKLEDRAKTFARYGDVDAAIDALDQAIKERQADPNQQSNPDRRHDGAIGYLQWCVDALKVIRDGGA